ncbi:GM10283 [Drosophila sechellia]|uniref:GM10283 n=1 Tax=Drosophila sechellia TaxID=7238 RepID=B4ICG4_DROSE|nr:GM10283 [Drosophila sechellia]
MVFIVVGAAFQPQWLVAKWDVENLLRLAEVMANMPVFACACVAEKFLAKRAAHLMYIGIIRSLLSNFARTSSAQQQSKRLSKIETLNYKVWANICLKLLQSKEVENEPGRIEAAMVGGGRRRMPGSRKCSSTMRKQIGQVGKDGLLSDVEGYCLAGSQVLTTPDSGLSSKNKSPELLFLILLHLQPSKSVLLFVIFSAFFTPSGTVHCIYMVEPHLVVGFDSI